MSDVEQDFADEVADLHQFFEDWFRGTGGRSINDFADRLDAGFVIVNPGGHRLSREQIISVVEARAGGYDTAITTTHATLAMSEPVLIGTYREHQEFKGETTHLVATVAMVADTSTPTGYRWLSVHETWFEDQT